MSRNRGLAQTLICSQYFLVQTIWLVQCRDNCDIWYAGHQITSPRLGPKVITVTVIRVIHSHHNVTRSKRIEYVGRKPTNVGMLDRRHTTFFGWIRDWSVTVSVNVGGRNISIVMLLFPLRLQLSCTRKLTIKIYWLCSLFLPRHFGILKLFRGYRTRA